MASKLELKNRSWLIRIGTGTGDDAIQFEGLDFQASIVKSLRPEPNKCSLTIFNLSPEHRAAIEQENIYDPKRIKGQKRTGQRKVAAGSPKFGKIRVEIEAGYLTTGRHLIARMDLRRALSNTDGPTVVTKIEGEDGGRSVLASRVSQSFPAGTTRLAVVRACAEALGLGTGNLIEVAAKLQQPYSAGTVLTGQASEELRGILRRAGLSYSIQNGVLQFRDVSAGRTTTAYLVDSQHGMVGSPERDAAGQLVVTTLLLPGVAPGAYIDLRAKHVQGVYRVNTVTYELDSAGTDWYSKLELVPG